HIMGNNDSLCSYCNLPLTPTKLLYPIGEKNYHLDGFISSQWETLGDLLKRAFMVTIFGYGAPTSDASAIELMKKAWGDVNSRNMEQIEIIDKRDEDDLVETWEPFIHTHHYRVKNNFYDSWIANHPRRTGEAYLNQYIEAMFIENNPLPQNADFEELWDWYDRLQSVEDKSM
ncbi:MAG: hypothetical protein IMF07_05780, partial [Proteobacteria bacterium]|nr:hypothetical protein [Pseudomonadota bacterium]